MVVDPGTIVGIVTTGLFNAAILFLVAAGLQVVFGVQGILNLACGSFYALGAYAGVVVAEIFISAGGPPVLSIFVLVLAGLALFFIGPVIERGMLRFVYGTDEVYHLLMTFALVLIIEDVIRFVWGTFPRQTSGIYLQYGQFELFDTTIPIYNLLVIVTAGIIALATGYLLTNTKFGKRARATAQNKEMAAALGINVNRVYIEVFTLGTVLGTIGGALVIPTTAATLGMAIELIVLAFAVVVIGGLGSMLGALLGAVVVGLSRAVVINVFPPAELIVVYALVILVLLIKPEGLLGETQ